MTEEVGSKAALNALAWQETDAATGIRDDLFSAIELARQEAGKAGRAGKALVTMLDEVDSQLRRHERWIPPDNVDELPVDRLRKTIGAAC